MTLSECVQKVSNREYMTWLAYFGDQWNEPDRSDYYLMQIAMEVRRVLHSNPSQVKLEHAKIPFTPIESGIKKIKKPLTAAERDKATALAKAAWAGRLSASPKKLPPAKSIGNK